MATQDISRHLFQPEKRYSGLRMQQGRIILDADFNEGEMIDDEEQRLTIVDVVGPHGSSDAGLTITTVDLINYDFDILAGSYYLGGLRQAIADKTDPAEPQSFKSQSNWLQWNRDDEEPSLPTLPLVPRHDLVYLVGWEQSVSAVEDGEIQEQALGGPDTSVRIRRMHRVYVRPGGPDTCAGAFGALVTDLTTGGHSFDYANHELKSAARLTVEAGDDGESGDLCTPPVLQGYAGAENQAIRIQLIQPDRFIWSWDNASPLYRIGVPSGEGTVTVTLLTPPRDQAHFPLVGQVLEILPWGARLPNGEHVADHEIHGKIGGGVLARVSKTYNPSTQQLEATVVDTSALAEMGVWFVDNAVPEADRYFYMRVWNPGDNAPPGAFGVSFLPDTPVALTGTGLKVKFNQSGIIGDYWVIAARPSTPNQVVPWELGTGTAPHGPRRFYAPLALLHWFFNDLNALDVNIETCRRTFRPLTRQGGCCTVTVGDGITSFGDYSSINEALRNLPSNGPCKVCVLPGVYEERVIIGQRSNLILEGCRGRSIIRTPASNNTSQGLVSITDCTNITLKDLNIEAEGQFGVTIIGDSTQSKDITLENLDITTRRDADLLPPDFDELWVPTTSAAFPLCTVAAYNADGLRVLGCKLTMIGDLSAAANVLVFTCTGVLIRDSEILTPPGQGTVSKAWGGIHVAANCHDVEINHNEIREGLGYGITLGSVTFSTEDPPDYTDWFDSGGRVVLDPGQDCPGSGGDLPFSASPPGGGDPVAIEPGRPIEDLRVYNNRISLMGSSGISVLGFWAEPASILDPYQMLETHDVVLADNIVENNYSHPSEDPLPGALKDLAAFGGIILADADRLRIHDNVIQNNGADHLHPVCGIYVLHGENTVVENNQVRNNGPRIDGTALSGIRAGIALQLVGRRVTPSTTAGGFTIEAEKLQPAARVRGNIVLQPAGRALQVYGLGPILVEGNVLVSEGLDGLDAGDLATAAHCVEIQNIGQSSDLILSGTIPADIAFIPAPPLLYDPFQDSELLIDGRILFTNNQIRFNPASGTSTNVFCTNRFQSYGDIGVLDNQFFVKFPTSGGNMTYDTLATGWSVRAVNNRWEDPAAALAPEVYATDVSALTLSYMNITTLNQASRCINALAASGSTHLYDPAGGNQIYESTGCSMIIPQFALLLQPPP